jgi:hydroxymethylpyrimidine pyrophosphatase-like HAD family hydrolase
VLLAALATDYDGTLAHDGRTDAATIDALIQLRDSGRRVIIVTGRELPDLERVFPECMAVSDAIVAENGALLYLPATREERVLAPAPPPEFVEALRRAQVSPLSVGRSIVATWEPEEHKVLEVIAELGLEWQIIFNKGAVMCLFSTSWAWAMRRTITPSSRPAVSRSRWPMRWRW